jgi:WD40 repeat protein
LSIWDARSGKSVSTLAGHQQQVNGCAWSPNGLRIVSASYDLTLRIWDARSGKSVAILTAHQQAVRGCAWSPDGLQIVSASHDGTVRIWDAVAGVEVAPTMYHLSRPGGAPTGCSVDHPRNRIVACGEEAWRSLGWIVRDPDGWPEWAPAETFGKLPVSEPTSVT